MIDVVNLRELPFFGQSINIICHEISAVIVLGRKDECFGVLVKDGGPDLDLL